MRTEYFQKASFIPAFFLLTMLVFVLLGCKVKAKPISKMNRFEDISYELTLPVIEVQSEKVLEAIDSFTERLEIDLRAGSWNEDHKPLVSIGVATFQDTTRITLSASSNYGMIFNSPDADLSNNLLPIRGIIKRQNYYIRVGRLQRRFTCKDGTSKEVFAIKELGDFVKFEVPSYQTKKGEILWDNKYSKKEKYFLDPSGELVAVCSDFGSQPCPLD